MPKDPGTRYSDFPQRAMDEVGLRLGRPNGSARARAVAESRAIERNDATVCDATSTRPLDEKS